MFIGAEATLTTPTPTPFSKQLGLEADKRPCQDSPLDPRQSQVCFFIGAEATLTTHVATTCCNSLTRSLIVSVIAAIFSETLVVFSLLFHVFGSQSREFGPIDTLCPKGERTEKTFAQNEFENNSSWICVSLHCFFGHAL